MELPWIEKHRPNRLCDVIGNEEILGRFKAMVNKMEVLNMILVGPPGTGKTTSAICLAKEVLGDRFESASLELNASDDRGVEVVRERIRAFSKMLVDLPNDKPKIVIMDEADSMTEGAQQALRTIIESYSDTTRFILTCNLPNKIIEPIQSRCIMLRFSSLSEDLIMKKIMEICRLEGVKYSRDGIERLLFSSQGDLRLSVNYLQSIAFGFGVVTSENVQKIIDKPHPKHIQNILDSSISGNFQESLKAMIEIWSLGYSSIDLIGTMFLVMRKMNIESEKIRLDILKEIGMTQMRILDGHSSLSQLLGLISRIIIIAQSSK